KKYPGQSRRSTHFHVLTVSKNLPSLIAEVNAEHDGNMSQMPEKLAEGNVRIVDQSQDSTFAGYTRQPPWNTDPDFKWLRGFAPAFFQRHNSFRIVFVVGRRRFRPSKKNRRAASESCHEETNEFLSRPIVHSALVFLLVTSLQDQQALS